MTTDRERGADLVGKVLDELAEKISVYSEEWDGIGKQSCLNMLEERLGPLLRLGEAAHSHHSDYCHVGDPDQVNYPDHCVCNKPKWDAALATLEGRE